MEDFFYIVEMFLFVKEKESDFKEQTFSIYCLSATDTSVTGLCFYNLSSMWGKFVTTALEYSRSSEIWNEFKRNKLCC